MAPFRWFANTSLARSLRFRLIMTVLLASLPAIGLLFITASQQRGDALDAGQSEVDRLALVAAAEYGNAFISVQRELSLLTRLPELTGGNRLVCQAFVRDLIGAQHWSSQRFVELRVVSRDGTVWCQSSISNPFGQTENPAYYQAAIDGEAFTVGEYRISPLTDRAILSFASPVTPADGSPRLALIATVDLQEQTNSLTLSTLPEGVIVSVIQSNGRMLAQQPEQDDVRVGDLIATPVMGPGPENTRTQLPIGSSLAVKTDGYISGMSPIRVTGADTVLGQATVLVQMPEAEILRPANATFRDNLGKLGVTIVVIILAAWVLSDLFVARDSETRKSVVSELYHAYTSGVAEQLDTIIAPDFQDHSPAPNQAPGVEGLLQTIQAFRVAFPDGEMIPREMFADHDKVVARVTLTGTHVGEYHGIRPSGKRMIANGMETFQFRNGVICGSWSLFGPLVEMRQLERRAPDAPPVSDGPGWLTRLWNRLRRRRPEPEDAA